MNVAILRGRLSSAPRTVHLSSGDALVRYEVTVPRAGEPAESVPVAWFAPGAPPAVGAGDEVVVVGRVRRRFFGGGAGGGARSSTEVVADAVLAATDRRRVRAALTRAAATVAE
jgi:hypothetical protein